MTELTISKEKWNSISDEQRAMLKGLGFVIEEKLPAQTSKPKAVKSAVSHAADYYLGVKTTCRTCSTDTVEVFLMTGVNKSSVPNLTAVCPINIEPDSMKPDKWLLKSIRVCKHCRQTLMTWDKETIIEYLLHRTAACYGCPKESFNPSKVFITGD